MNENKDNKEKKKVALYIRVSTDEQAEMYGVDLQRNALMGLIASKVNEYEFAGSQHVYIDEGESGTLEPEDRPAFRALLEDASVPDEKPFDIVAVYKIDRFARRLKILLEIMDKFNQEDFKLEFISAHENIDTSTPFGRAMLGIIGVIAELELETIKERTRAGRLASAEKGGYMGIPPLGYVKSDDLEGKIVIQEEEAEIVKMIFDLFVNERMSKEAIASYLVDRKIQSPLTYRYEHSKEDTKKQRTPSIYGPYQWHPSAVKTVLENEIYIGNQYYNRSKDGKKLPKEDWKLYIHQFPLFSPTPDSLFFQAQKLLQGSGNRYYARKDKNRRYLLQGLLKCANCFDPVLHDEPYAWHGTPHMVKSTGKPAYYYECSSKHSGKKKARHVTCKVVSLPAKNLEKYVLDYIFNLVDNPKIVFEYQQKLQSKKLNISLLEFRLKTIIALINTHESSKSRIVELYSDGRMSKEAKDEAFKESDRKHKNNLAEKEKIEKDLAIFTAEGEYIKVFEVFKEQYAKFMKEYKQDIEVENEEFYRLVHMIVEEIIVFSRPKTDKDSVSGRKVEGQMIPYMLKITLKIPSEMLMALLKSLSPEEKLQAKKRGWWAT